MDIHTLKSKDGKLLVHGKIINWLTWDEFLFIPITGSVFEPWWCKTDFWDITYGLTFGKINVAQTI